MNTNNLRFGINTGGQNLSKYIVFVMPDTVQSGPQNVWVKFPFRGKIVGCQAYCATPAIEPTTVDIQKISETGFNNDLPWKSIFVQKVAIDANTKTNTFSTTPYSFDVTAIDIEINDYFCISVNPGRTIKDLSVQLEIKI